MPNNEEVKEYDQSRKKAPGIDVIVAMGVGVLIGAFGVIAWLLHD